MASAYLDSVGLSHLVEAIHAKKQNVLTYSNGIEITEDNITADRDYIQNGIVDDFVGDGATDNLEIFNTLYAANPTATFLFQDGIFCFSGSIVTNSTHIIIRNATLRFTADCDYGIKARGTQDDEHEHPEACEFITGFGGHIDCNNHAKVGIGIGTGKMFDVGNLRVYNVPANGIGIHHGITDRAGMCYEANVHDVIVENYDLLSGTVGIRMAGDSYYTNIVTTNMLTGIKVDSGLNFLSNYHPWNYDFQHLSGNRMGNTIGIKHDDTILILNNYFMDTVETGILNSSSSGRIIASGLYCYINSAGGSFNKTPVLFSGRYGSYGENLVVTGAYFNPNRTTYFRDSESIDMSLSTLVGVSYNSNVKYFPTKETMSWDACPTPLIYTAATNKAYVDNSVTTVNDDLTSYVNSLVSQLADGSYVACTDIDITDTEITIEPETTQTVNVTLTPANATHPIQWSSSDSTVCTVANGVITGVADGTATVTATCNGHSDSVTVTIASIPYVEYATDVVLDGTTGLSVAMSTPILDDTHYIELSMDLSNNTYGHNLWAVGITDGLTWTRGHVLMYRNSSTDSTKMRIQWVGYKTGTTVGCENYDFSVTDDSNVVIQIHADGTLYADGKLLSASSGYAAAMSDCLALLTAADTLYAGTNTKGDDGVYGITTFNYIRVVNSAAISA